MMMIRREYQTVAIRWGTACLLAMLVTVARAERPFANVPPTLEIEVLDPGVDPSGNPAVRLQPRGDGQLNVDIPPVVLVHRYYYSGDRSFQGPMLPGGPSIIVVNHPQTNERTYIPAQMMPGAPRVTYTKNDIEYDYGSHAITVHFGWLGKPTVKYRSGVTWQKKVATALHTEELSESAAKLKASTHETSQHVHRAMKGALVETGELAKTAATPVINTMQMLPFGSVLMSGDLTKRLEERAAEYDRQRDARKMQREKERQDITFRTNR